MSDLMERLLSESFGPEGKSYPHLINPDGPEAADRIEQLEAAFIAACAFIDSHIADPDLNDEMIENYRKFLEARHALQETSDEEA